MRKLVEGPGTWATKRAAIQTHYNTKLKPKDKAEIKQSPQWVDLVEAKFTGMVPGAVPPEKQSDNIKKVLKIPL
jgi:hypothetical protein